MEERAATRLPVRFSGQCLADWSQASDVRSTGHLRWEPMRFDLHVHTEYSKDSLTSLDRCVRWALMRGLDGIAVTDHNTVRGALQLVDQDQIRVIVGSEVMTTAGEITGLFLTRGVLPGLPPREVVNRIHDQGGLVCVPHPFDRARDSAIERRALLAIVDDVDLIEGLNARVLNRRDNIAAQEFARAYDKPMTAGSDGHCAREIGRAYAELASFDGAVGFMDSLREARLCGSVSTPLVHVASTGARLAKQLCGALSHSHGVGHGCGNPAEAPTIREQSCEPDSLKAKPP